MPYEPQEWENDPPSKATPLSAERLNYMEEGIRDASANASTAVDAVYAVTVYSPWVYTDDAEVGAGQLALCITLGAAGYTISVYDDGAVHGGVCIVATDPVLTGHPIDVEYHDLLTQATATHTIEPGGSEFVLRYFEDLDIPELSPIPVSGWWGVEKSYRDAWASP